jgi:hypothetical protein
LELKQVQEQYELDLKAPADVAEVEAQVANYDYLLTEQQSNLELALIELRKVMNYPQEEPLEIDTEVDIEGMLITETLEEVLNYALVYNPQIRSKEMNSRYYELNYASTKGRYLPSISLSGGFSTNYFVNVDSPGNYAKYFNQLGNNRGYYVGMSMSIPIFSGLSRRVAKHRAKLQYDNAILAHTEQRRTLESEVAKTYQEMQNFGKQYIMSQKKVQANDLAYRSALHLHAVRGALGFNGGFGLAVAHEQIAGGDLAHQCLYPGFGAGSFGSGDQCRVARVFLQERRVLADHIQLGVVVQHRLADDHIPDADLAGHVACNAGEDDLLRAELGDEHLRGSGGVGLAHTGAAHHHLLAGQRALVVLHAAVGLNGDIFQLCTQLVYFIGHSAHNTQDHGGLL